MNRSEIPSLVLLPPLFIFAVSMGFLEAIVVVYIRELFYPEGFAFPLKPMETWLIGTEMVRELCTLLMLWAVASISGRSFIRRLAAFLFLFGIWDIFYYVALWIFLGWPQSLLTWDILFLIPVTWTGPVLAPVLCSLTMILLAVLLERQQMKYGIKAPGKKTLILFITGSILIMVAFMYDFSILIVEGNYLSQFFSLAENTAFLQEMMLYVPDRFQWEIFSAGLLIILTGIFPLLKKRG
ncbi:MAG: hypothetical protein ACOC0R_01760 [Mariniphaga sp.]